MPKLVTTKRFASGKYSVFIDGNRIPAVIVGARGKFNLEYRNDYRGQFTTIKLAAEHAAEHHAKFDNPLTATLELAAKQGIKPFAEATIFDGLTGTETQVMYGVQNDRIVTLSPGGYFPTFGPDHSFKDHNDAFCNGLTKLPGSIKPGTLKPLSKLLKNYIAAKSIAKDVLLVFRMGDFYELLYDDARIASKALGLTLQKRSDAPMTGFPYHQLETYLAKLKSLGFRFSIVETNN